MNATATIAPADRRNPGLRPARLARPAAGGAGGRPQYMRALQRANEVRLARAELKRKIANGECDVAEVLLECPWEAANMPVADLLTSQRRWGHTRCRKFLAQVPMSEKKTIDSLTDRQRQTLVAMLRGARVCSLPEVRATPERYPW